MTATATKAPPEQRLGELGLADLSGVGPFSLVRIAVRTSPVLREGLLLTVLLALVAGGGRIVTPLAVQWAIDRGLATDAVTRAVVLGAAATALAWAASWAMSRRLTLRIEQAVAGLRRDGLSRAHEMAGATADRVPSADLVSRLTSDLDQVTTFLQGGGTTFVTNAAQLVIATVVMLAYSWILTVPVLTLSAVLCLVMVVVQRIVARRFARVRAEVSRMQSVVAESVAGVPVIRSTGTAHRARAKLDEAVDRARDSLLRTLVPLHGNTSLGEIAISTITVAVVLGGVWWGRLGDPAHPRLTAGQVVAMVFLVTLFVRPLQGLVQSLGDAQNAVTGWRRALELVVTPSSVVTVGPELPDGGVLIELDDVSARYGDGPLALHGISLRIECGEHVAVVGRTGSGKSTFAKLLTRRIEPASGTIRFGGEPLERLTDGSLARRVVIVPQEPFLFDGTLRANVVLGRPAADDAAVLDIVDRLRLTEWFATLPDGLDTVVGQRGERLSVGERQLVALVRTALADPDLVVLDEATSGVDPATDIAVQDALAVLTRGRTTVSIAHRMITAASADRVLVFREGRVVQSGHHLELIDEPGPYADLFAAWRQRGAGTPAHVARN